MFQQPCEAFLERFALGEYSLNQESWKCSYLVCVSPVLRSRTSSEIANESSGPNENYKLNTVPSAHGHTHTQSVRVRCRLPIREMFILPNKDTLCFRGALDECWSSRNNIVSNFTSTTNITEILFTQFHWLINKPLATEILRENRYLVHHSGILRHNDRVLVIGNVLADVL